MIENFRGLVDSRNEWLWNEIAAKFNVQIQPIAGSEHSVFSKNMDVTFYVPRGTIDPDSFTHEMLHVYLRSREIFIGSNLILTIRGSQILKRVFTEDLLEHISNVLDHIKMYPLYQNMGYRPEMFISDFSTYKCDPQLLKKIENHYKEGRWYNASAVDVYIGRYFSVKADFNEAFDYRDCLKRLRKIDETLFEALEQFHDEWNEFDITTDDKLYSYRDVVSNFYDDLKQWITGKSFH